MYSPNPAIGFCSLLIELTSWICLIERDVLGFNWIRWFKLDILVCIDCQMQTQAFCSLAHTIRALSRPTFKNRASSSSAFRCLASVSSSRCRGCFIDNHDAAGIGPLIRSFQIPAFNCHGKESISSLFPPKTALTWLTWFSSTIWLSWRKPFFPCQNVAPQCGSNVRYVPARIFLFTS